MKSHFEQAPQPTTKRRVDVSGPDFYPTPRWATMALVRNEPFEGGIWEPACGDGAMADVLASCGYDVEASDLHDRSYGESGVDFLTSTRMADNIVTNPPYHSAEAFVHAGLKLARRKLALLLRLAFLEGVGRQKSIFSVAPPSRVWVFSERITFYPKGADRKGSGTTAYAWLDWDRQANGASEIRWIRPGCRKAYLEPSVSADPASTSLT